MRSYRLLAYVLLGLLAQPTTAAMITYTATPLGGSTWRYDYTVSNDSLLTSLSEFTIWFQLGVYDDLATAASPAGWDPLVIQPDAGLPADGYFDALALGEGIASDASLGGFGVTFTYLGSGTPGGQPFQVVDPNSFAVLASGTTAVPAPPAAWLLGTGVLLAASRSRKSRRRPME